MPTIICNNQETDLVPVNKAIALNSCPACGSGVERDGPFYLCKNRNECSGVHNKRLKKWVSKRNIMFLGNVNLDILIGSGIVKNISDFYDLTVESMIMVGISDGMAKKIHKQIEISKVCSLSDMLGSMSLDMLGRSEAANLIAHGVNSLTKWKMLTPQQIESFPGYKSTKANRISKSVQDNWELIESVASKLVVSIVSTPSTQKTKNKMNRYVVCLTGKMSKGRKDIAKDIETAGHQVLDRVEKGITHLCQADPSSQSSKSKKAAKLGIPVISEEELYEMIQCETFTQ